MNDVDRAIAFMREHAHRGALRVRPFSRGNAVFHDAVPNVYDLNFVDVVDSAEASAADLVAAADELQAGLAHRRVNVRDGEDGRRLESGFRALGWQVERHALMIRRRAPDGEVDTSGVDEVTNAELEPARAEAARAYPWGKSAGLVTQLRDARRAQAAATNPRFFAARVDGRIAAYADLYSDGRTAQIEDVHTLPAYRGRGLARAVVSRAAEEALRAGHDLVFLVADYDDWPKELYAKLGFDRAALTYRFLLPSARATAARGAGRRA